MLKRVQFFLGKNWLVIFCLVLAVLTILPLLHSGFFSMHDDEQIGRLYDLNQALHEGQFPVRITSNLGFGYGYTLFNFYPPFVYYFANLFKELGFSYLDSTKIQMAFGFFLSWLFMYFFARSYWSKQGSALAATVYLFAPYHAVDIYVRGAVPEFWAFVFVPALFWAFKKIDKSLSLKYSLLGAVFIGLLILTHNLVALMTMPFIGTYFLYLLYSSKTKKKLFLKSSISAILGLLVSAFFWIPAILEKGYTMVDLLTIEKADYVLHFVYFRQFLFSKWGYSGSVAGPWDGISFNLGPVHLVLLSISILAFIYLLKKNVNKIYIIFFLLFAFSIFIQTVHSKFIWDKVYGLSYLQFPWRFLLFSSFFLAFLTGIIPELLKGAKKRTLLAFCLLVLVAIFNKDYFKPEKQFLNAKDADYINEKFIRWDTSKLAFEYVPKGIKTKRTQFETTGVAISENDIRKNDFEVTSGKMEVSVITYKANKKIFRVNSTTDGILNINTFDFPGWKAFLDGKQIEYSSNGPLKLISVEIPTGEHILSVEFTDTSIRRVANMLSLIGVAIFALLLLASRRNVKIPYIND